MKGGHSLAMKIAAACVTMGAVLAAYNWASGEQSPAEKRSRASATAPANRPTVQGGAVASRQPLEYYRRSVSGTMFTAPQALPAFTPAPRTPSKPAAPTPPPAEPPPPDPVGDYSFTGLVEVGGVRMALVENIKTREGQYLRQSDRFLNGSVKSIDTEAVVLNLPAGDRRLARNTDFSLVPLLNPNAKPAQPQGPGGPKPEQGPPPNAPKTNAGQDNPLSQVPAEIMNAVGTLPPDVQKRMYDEYMKMSPAQRQEAINMWMAMPPDQRQRMLQGMSQMR